MNNGNIMHDIMIYNNNVIMVIKNDEEKVLYICQVNNDNIMHDNTMQ